MICSLIAGWPITEKPVINEDEEVVCINSAGPLLIAEHCGKVTAFTEGKGYAALMQVQFSLGNICPTMGINQSRMFVTL